MIAKGVKGEELLNVFDLKNSLNHSYSTLGTYPWQQLDVVTVASAKQAGNQLVMAIILLIATIAIINTVILAALERMQEIGMMLSLGLKKSEIIYIFIIESTGIGILGGVIALVMGFFGVLAMTNYGINFDLITGIELSKFGVPIIGEMYGIWNPNNSGHIKIIDQEYYQQERVLPLNYNVDGFKDKSLSQMKTELKNIKNVERLISRLKFGAVVSTSNELINMAGELKKKMKLNLQI